MSTPIRRIRSVCCARAAPTINFTVTVLRFFFGVTVGRLDVTKSLTFVHEPRRLPTVLSPEEVVRLLEAAPGIKYKAAPSAAYGAGLRVSEVAALKVSDIDSKRMMLRIEQGKGRKDRYAMLSPVLLALLRDWYRIAQPRVWLFPGRDPVKLQLGAGRRWIARPERPSSILRPTPASAQRDSATTSPAAGAARSGGALCAPLAGARG